MTTAVSDPSATSRKVPGSEFNTLRVADVEQLCDDAVAVTFAVPDTLADDYAFAPGQTLVLRRTVDGVEHRRSYSICNPVGAAPRVGVREVPGGLFSEWLVREVSAGDEIDVATPSGNFVADPTEPGHHLLVAAGSGITPVLSIAASVLANPESRVTLVYGNRNTGSVMFAEEVADLKDAHRERLSIMHLLSREPRDVEMFTGRVDTDHMAAILDDLIRADQIDHAWLCGPLEMVEQVRATLLEHGMPAENVHRELFFVDGPPPAPRPRTSIVGDGVASSQVTVVLDGKSTTAALPQDETILDAAEKIRADLPFACKGGVCGTCRAKVTCGEVDMRRNYALEDSEVADGFVLTCQTFPVSDDVTVDFDA
ncbi:1,2-phenylacetyl-CoA epoxidase subunit PaaE [Gordonia sp. NPDC003424]